MKRYFNYEKDIQSLLTSGNIVQLYGHSITESGACHLLLEYCNGGDLNLLLKKRNRPLSQNEAHVVFRKMLESLRDCAL